MTSKIEDILSGAGGQSLMPRETVAEIWDKAHATAVLPQIAKTIPAVIGETAVPYVSERPKAQIQGEREATKASKATIGAKTFITRNVRVGVPVTQEALESDPAGSISKVKELLAGALAEQIDIAAIHGVSAIDLATVADADTLASVTNSVELGAIADASMDIWAGHGLVAGAGYNYSGLIADPAFTSRLANSRDSEGRRLHPEIGLGGLPSSFEGVPLLTTPNVSGAHLGIDSNLRAIGGDWSALYLAQGDTMRMSVVPYGDPLGTGRDMASHREVALILDTRLGWAIMDPGAFVKYVAPDATP